MYDPSDVSSLRTVCTCSLICSSLAAISSEVSSLRRVRTCSLVLSSLVSLVHLSILYVIFLLSRPRPPRLSPRGLGDCHDKFGPPLFCSPRPLYFRNIWTPMHVINCSRDLEGSGGQWRIQNFLKGGSSSTVALEERTKFLKPRPL